MATGHLNPGYNRVVTKFKSALSNPSGEPQNPKINQSELDEIRMKARHVWSAKDNSETTYGYYFSDPMIKQKANLRPTSPTRRNNPHPNKVFLATRLRHLPGYFNDEDRELNDEYSSYNQPGDQENYRMNSSNRSRSAKPMVSREPRVSVYQNAKHYLQSLPSDESQQEDERLRRAGIDSTQVAQTEALSSSSLYAFNSKNEPEAYETCSPKTTGCKRQLQLQTNALNPYLYDDMRIYREKYANGDHGMPNPNGKKPFRGDFLIHPDWHPRLNHHRLPYDI